MTRRTEKKPVGYGLYLIGPVIERDDGESYFIAAFSDAKGFTADCMVVPVGQDPVEARASFLRMAQNNCFGEGGAEAFDDEHALLIRAAAIWPSRKTKRALAEFEQSMALADRLNEAGVRPDDTLH